MRAICAGRAAAFSARDSAAAESAVSTIARARAARPSRSPTAAAVGIVSASPCALFLISAGVARVRLEPRLEQGHLGGQVVVTPSVVCQPGGGLTGLPRPDGPLTVGGAHVDRALLVHPAPPAGR